MVGNESKPVPEERNPDIELLRIALQKSRLNLLNTILSHPKKQPSLNEIVYANPSLSKTTIRGHLQKLVDHDIVEERRLPKEHRKRDLPSKFFVVSDEAYETLSDHDIFAVEDILSEIYRRTEKDEKIQKYENAPRPDEVE